MTLTCVGWRLEESGAWSQGYFRADPLVEGNKDPRVYWRVSLAPPDLWALCRHNEIRPDQRRIRVAGDDACRFIVTDELLKRAVSLLHVCSCAVFTAADCYRLAARCADCTCCFMVSVCPWCGRDLTMIQRAIHEIQCSVVLFWRKTHATGRMN